MVLAPLHLAKVRPILFYLIFNLFSFNIFGESVDFASIFGH